MVKQDHGVIQANKAMCKTDENTITTDMTRARYKLDRKTVKTRQLHDLVMFFGGFFQL